MKKAAAARDAVQMTVGRVSSSLRDLQALENTATGRFCCSLGNVNARSWSETWSHILLRKLHMQRVRRSIRRKTLDLSIARRPFWSQQSHLVVCFLSLPACCDLKLSGLSAGAAA